MANYTLGPLTVKKAEGGNDWAIVDNVGKVIGEAFYQVDFDTYRPAEANARLWSQATRLLEALDSLFVVLAQVDTVYESETGRTIEQDFAEELDKARAAIADAIKGDKDG